MTVNTKTAQEMECALTKWMDFYVNVEIITLEKIVRKVSLVRCS